MKKISLIVVLALITAGVANATVPQVLIDENFDGLAIGAMPTGWTTETDTPPTATGASTEQAASGTQSLKLYDETAATYNSRLSGMFAAPVSGDDIVVSFKMYYQHLDTLGLQTSFTVGLKHNSNKLCSAYMRVDGGNDWINDPWYGHTGYLKAAGLNSWLDVQGRIEWDSVAGEYTTGSFDVWDGEDWASWSGPLNQSGVTDADRFWIAMSGPTPGSYLLIDDVYVELLPEPATMLLLGLGGLLLRRRVA